MKNIFISTIFFCVVAVICLLAFVFAFQAISQEDKTDHDQAIDQLLSQNQTIISNQIWMTKSILEMQGVISSNQNVLHTDMTDHHVQLYRAIGPTVVNTNKVKVDDEKGDL